MTPTIEEMQGNKWHGPMPSTLRYHAKMLGLLPFVPDEVYADLHFCADAYASALEQLEAAEKAIGHNIRERVIRMIEQGYFTVDDQQVFFPDVPRHVLDAVFAEPFVAALPPMSKVE